MNLPDEEAPVGLVPVVSLRETVLFYILSSAKAASETISGSFCSSLPCCMPVEATTTHFGVQFEQIIDLYDCAAWGSVIYGEKSTCFNSQLLVMFFFYRILFIF